MRQFIYLKDVVTLVLEEENCIGCGICLIVCPHAVLSMNAKHARIRNRDACMECGACARNCPTGAITVDTGVGCAGAVINAALGRTGSSCCCTVEQNQTQAPECGEVAQSGRIGCC